MKLDVLAAGYSYRDLIFTGVERLPAPGEERYAQGFHEMWGGMATMARVSAALGQRTGMATTVGDDDASTRFLHDLTNMGIDCAHVHREPGWSLPVTVAMSLPDDRAMLTVEDPLPRDVLAHLEHVDARAVIVDLRDPAAPWLRDARERGATIYASRGFDPTEKWDDDALAGIDGADCWMLNDLEAERFTGCADPAAAARKLAERVPVVVVTMGAAGLLAVDSHTGEQARVEAFPVTPASTTGAGDTSLAAFAFARTARNATLRDALDLTAFVAATVLGSARGVATPPTRAELRRRAEATPRASHLIALLAD